MYFVPSYHTSSSASPNEFKQRNVDKSRRIDRKYCKYIANDVVSFIEVEQV